MSPDYAKQGKEFENLFPNVKIVELLELEEGNNRQFELYDNLSEFIENFEESKRNKKTIKKNKGLELFFEE